MKGSSPVTRFGARRGVVLAVALGLLVPLAAGWALLALHDYSKRSVVAVAHLGMLESDVNATGTDLASFLDIRASYAVAEPTMHAHLAGLTSDIATLRADDGGGVSLANVADSADAYTRTVTAALALIDAGLNRSSAQMAADARATAQLTPLVALIRDRTAEVSHESSRAESVNRVGVWVVVCTLSAILLAGLWWISRVRRVALAKSERTFRVLFERNPIPMSTVDPRTLRFLTVNDATVATYGYTRDEFLSMTVCDIRADRETPTPYVDDRSLAQGPGASAADRHRLKDGTVIDVDVVVDRLQAGDTTVRLVAARNVSDQRRLEAELRDLALHDALTGLANRALFADRFGHAQNARARSTRGLAVVLVDIDGFKVVNDTLSHAVGDEVLRTVADRLRGAVRPHDTVARMGGDEFALLIEDADMPTVLSVVGRLLAAVSAPMEVAGVSVDVTASAGVATVADAEVAWDTALQRADVAMYVAKEDGKARFRVYKHGMDSLVLNRLEIGAQLNGAVARGEMELHYQPIVSRIPVAGHSVEQVEALIRWRHPTRGPISPAEFIPISEQTGVIVPLGAWVLRTACDQVAAWERQGRRLIVSINVSGRQLREADFTETVAGVLRATGVRPGAVILEVTETAMLEDFELAQRTLNRIRAMGVSVALDDFGAGYSSLRYLTELPVDEVKIDGSFIAGLDDVEKRAMIKMIVGMLDSLGVRTVAEGVETAEQVAHVAGLGIDACQGFYFSPPVPAAGLLAAVERCEADAREAADGGLSAA